MLGLAAAALALPDMAKKTPTVHKSHGSTAAQHKQAALKQQGGAPKPKGRVCPLTGEMPEIIPNHPPNNTVFPVDVMTCPEGAVVATPFMDEALYDEVAAAVTGVINDHPSSCEPGDCPRADFVGCVTRYVGHDLMDIAFDNQGDILGGMDGCIDFTNPDNNGLYGCLVGREPLALVTAYRKVCSRVSLADFAVLAAETAMTVSATDPDATRAAFKQNFMWGRT